VDALAPPWTVLQLAARFDVLMGLDHGPGRGEHPDPRLPIVG
jgi:hypothetical protein